MADTAVVRFEPLYEGVPIPRRATEHSAGYDLHVFLRGRMVRVRTLDHREEQRFAGDDDEARLVIGPGEVALMPLGFRAQLPQGFEAQIRMRSSWAFQRGFTLPNAPGTIDADYPDEWLVMVKNSGVEPQVVVHGDRIAQAILSKYEVLEWIDGVVGQVTDRRGGFGSTG
jgi:dUTP diphosphatase